MMKRTGRWERMGKLKWSFLVLVCVLMFGINASAAGTVAKIGKKSYPSLQAAVNKVKKGQTIKLQKNLKIRSKSYSDPIFSLDRNVSFTLDLNKHTITCLGPYSDININRGTVTIKNGSIKRGKKENYYGGGTIFVEKGAKLNITSGNFYNIEVSNRGGTVNVTGGNYQLTERTAFVNGGGKMTLSKLNITSSSNSSAIVNQKEWNGKKGRLYIKSGVYKSKMNSTYGTDCFLDNQGTASITGGTFTSSGKARIIENCGNLTIKKINCKNYGGSTCVGNYGADNAKEAKLVIKGGTFVSFHKSEQGKLLSSSNVTISAFGTVKISGGTFKAYGGPNENSIDHSPPYTVLCSEYANVSITGGKFSCPDKPSGWANVLITSDTAKVNCTASSVIMRRA